ncbi:DMT family transporter [Actinomarinicola tropica]|uniref:EamA family transporter n=1 Tax=Actinomarinicola tropica TaxID=2789776 RepID=A0A5Q2REQ9_9ACTN|nr:DMT family transporter [Actinomarinicola tropica]QGG94104.1 EamA family transporter [Actinomarinicola tropica]
MLWVTASWGACFVAIDWGLRDAPVLWFAALRSLIAGAALAVFAAIQQRPLPTGVRSWWLIALLALTNAGVAFAAMFGGVAGLATGTAAVLANAQPLLIVLPAWWLYGEQVTVRTGAALAVGFAGLLVVAVPAGGGKGAWLSILAAAAITVGTLLARRLAGTDVVQAAGWHFIIGGAGLAAVAAAVEGLPRITWTPRFVLVLAFLALVGTALAFWAWFTETLRSPLAPLAAWTFLTPLFGVAFAFVAGADTPAGWTAAGLVLVLAALWVVLRHPNPVAAAPPGRPQ